MKNLIALLFLFFCASCLGAPDRWSVEYGTGDGQLDSRKGGNYDVDSQWVAFGLSGAIGKLDEPLPVPPKPPDATVPPHEIPTPPAPVPEPEAPKAPSDAGIVVPPREPPPVEAIKVMPPADPEPILRLAGMSMPLEEPPLDLVGTTGQSWADRAEGAILALAGLLGVKKRQAIGRALLFKPKVKDVP